MKRCIKRSKVLIWCIHKIFLGRELSIEQQWDPQNTLRPIYVSAKPYLSTIFSPKPIKEKYNYHFISSSGSIAVWRGRKGGPLQGVGERRRCVRFQEMSSAVVNPSTLHTPQILLYNPHTSLTTQLPLTFTLSGIPKLVLGRWKKAALLKFQENHLNSSSLSEWRILPYSWCWLFPILLILLLFSNC